MLTVLDSYSRYIQAIPLENKKAEALIFRVLMNEGPPGMIYSDQGTEFKNVVMNRVMKYFGSTQKFSLANSPWTNAVERTHRTLGQLARMLQAKKMKDPEEWSKLILMACHSVNNSVCVSTGVSPSYLFKGRHVKTPLDLMFPEAEKEIKDLPEAVRELRRDYQRVQEAVKQQQEKNYHRLQKLYTGDKSGRFEIGDLILFFDDRAIPGVTGKLRPRWTGPHRVIRVENHQQYHCEEERTG